MLKERSRCRRAIEAQYGKLGEAQLAELDVLVRQVEGFCHFAEAKMWQEINAHLASKDYLPVSQREATMEELFCGGEEFPDIFNDLDEVEDVDMNKLL